jgi:hypothetical protein
MRTFAQSSIALALATQCLILTPACDRATAPALAPTPSPLDAGPPPVPPGGPWVLSGRVVELTASGPTPVVDVTVEVAICPPTAWAYERVTTGSDGMYRVAGMCAGTTYLWAGKQGYRINRKGAPQCDGDCVVVDITRDTRFDVEMVRE